MTQREAVWLADHGTCVACGKRWPYGTVLERRPQTWDAHHVIKAQTLRWHHAPAKFIRTERLCVLLCQAPCHGDQTSFMRPVPLDRLPERVLRAATELGPWAEDALRRQHPPR